MSANHAHLDLKYFIDGTSYNCPFCNRRHVCYHISGTFTFSWTPNQKCHVYFVECHSCRNVSLHLSFHELTEPAPLQDGMEGVQQGQRFKDIDIDAQIVHSVPTPFFVLDFCIPDVIRELLTEAESCRRMNFLVGAAGCIHRAVAEFFAREQALGGGREEKTSSLRTRFPLVDAGLFDIVGEIQEITSPSADQSRPALTPSSLRSIIETLTVILYEVYVAPKERSSRAAKGRQLLEALNYRTAPSEAVSQV